MRNVISRLLGVTVGRKVFDDGCILSERSLVEIGDEANLNEHAIVQAHSLEEGVFKSDFVRIGAGLLGRGRLPRPLRRDDERQAPISTRTLS